MADEQIFNQIFDRLKNILQPFAARLETKENQSGKYVLISPKRDERGKEIYFAALETKKNYVSFHLLPVYDQPGLLDNVSPALKKRMQGKSCFNFKKIENEIFDELSELVKNGFELYEQKAMI